MKIIVLLMFGLLWLTQQSTKDSPLKTTQPTTFSVQGPTFDVVEYYSMDNIPADLKDKEWYVFVKLQLPQSAFNDQYYYTFQTVAKDKDVESSQKVECKGRGSHFSDCFLGHSQIDFQNQMLKITLSFMKEINGSIRLDIFGVKNVKMYEPLTLQKGKEGYSRIVRMDVSTFTEKFKYLYCELKKTIVQLEEEYYYFLTSREETPPSLSRNDERSFSLWGVNKQIVYPFVNLEDADVITFSFELMDDIPYEFICKTTKSTKDMVELPLEVPIYEVIEELRVYHFVLPSRTDNIYYCLSVNDPLGFTNIAEGMQLDGRRVSLKELQQMGKRGEASLVRNRQQIWINSTVKDVKFIAGIASDNDYAVALLKLQVERFDTKLVQLKEDRVWTQSLKAKEVQYLFFIIDLKDPNQKVSFQARFFGPATYTTLKFMTCIQKTAELCKTELYKNSSLQRNLTFPTLTPQVNNHPLQVVYKFKDLMLTSFGMGDKAARSIVVVEVTAGTHDTAFTLSWHWNKQIKKLTENQIMRGSVDELQVFQFQVVESTNISFARIDFFAEGDCQVFGSDQLFSQTYLLQQYKNMSMVQQYNNAIVFHNLTSFKKYYVYFIAHRKSGYRLRLSYGFNWDINKNHTITKVVLGKGSKDNLMLQPGEVVFVEIKIPTQSWSVVHVQNYNILKVCLLYQQKQPTTHQEILDSEQCQNSRSIFSTGFSRALNETKRDFIGIQNQQQFPIEVTITSETDEHECNWRLMGQKQTVKLNATESQKCVLYQVSHKAEIEVLTDIANPQLKGIDHPTIHIADNFKIKMSSTSKVFTAQEIDELCLQDYQNCYIEIRYTTLEMAEIDQNLVTVFAGYTDHPMLLLDGVSHSGHIRSQAQVKHFKYAISSIKKVTISLKKSFNELYTLYAKVVTIHEKFMYPGSVSYLEHIKNINVEGQRQIYLSKQNSYAAHIHLDIPSSDILKVCMNQTQCYVLITIECKRFVGGQFVVQATQSYKQLKLGTSLKVYQEKDDTDFFHFYNPIESDTLIVLVSSHGDVCHKMSLSFGLDPYKNVGEKELKNQIMHFSAKKGFYTISVQATDDCYYTIQVSQSKKFMIQLQQGFGHPLYMKRGEKQYFLMRNEDRPMVKVISSMERRKIGELYLKAMPVKDDQLTNFFKFLNGKAELGKKSGLEYVWSGNNHLTMNDADPKYCKNCFICIQIEASQDLMGYLTLVSNQFQSMGMMYQSVTYDVLAKDQIMVWVFKYRTRYHDFKITLVAGSLSIQLFEDQKLESTDKLTFDQFNNTANIHIVKGEEKRGGKYIRLKVTALEDADYSLEVLRDGQGSGGNVPGNSTSQKHLALIGRPMYVSLTNSSSTCYQGVAFDTQQQFSISLNINWGFQSGVTSQQKLAKDLKDSLVVNATLNDQPEAMNVKLNRNLFLLNFTSPLKPQIANNFSICLSVNGSQKFSVIFMYLGSLNYLSENQQIHVRGNKNMTFVSLGRGVIEVDQCQSTATLVLSKTFSGLSKSSSDVRQRRDGSKYFFWQRGSLYLRAQSIDYVTLRWRNMHRENQNGFGYNYFSASQIRVVQQSKDGNIKVRIEPLKTRENRRQNNPPDILQIKYQIYIAKEQRNLYNAMNCEKGSYMTWLVTVSKQFNQTVEHVLNNIDDIRMLFREIEYVLVGVKAEVAMQWKANKQIQNYRFYYPYQELIINQISEPQTGPTTPPVQEDESMVIQMLIAIVVLLMVALVVVGSVRCYRRYVKVPRLLTEQELPSKSVSGSVQMEEGSYKYSAEK